MYQPKVSTTQTYSDGRSIHIVHEGKLLLIDHEWVTSYPKLYFNVTRLYDKKPIIISETEEIEIGDWVYIEDRNGDALLGIKVGILDWNGDTLLGIKVDGEIYFLITEGHSPKVYKILALPEHFSPKHLQAIVDGKMKDGDKVLIKCEFNRHKGMPNVEPLDDIHLNQQNHITLFPAKQSLEEVARIYANDKYPESRMLTSFGAYKEGFKEGAEWAKKNNYN